MILSSGASVSRYGGRVLHPRFSGGRDVPRHDEGSGWGVNREYSKPQTSSSRATQCQQPKAGKCLTCREESKKIRGAGKKCRRRAWASPPFGTSYLRRTNSSESTSCARVCAREEVVSAEEPVRPA